MRKTWPLALVVLVALLRAGADWIDDEIRKDHGHIRRIPELEEDVEGPPPERHEAAVHAHELTTWAEAEREMHRAGLPPIPELVDEVEELQEEDEARGQKTQDEEACVPPVWDLRWRTCWPLQYALIEAASLAVLLVLALSRASIFVFGAPTTKVRAREDYIRKPLRSALAWSRFLTFDDRRAGFSSVLLQIVIWTAAWGIVDSAVLIFADEKPRRMVGWYLVCTALGSVVGPMQYRVETQLDDQGPSTTVTAKAGRMTGFLVAVLLCAGIWGVLDSLVALAADNRDDLEILWYGIMILLACAAGAVHHWFRPGILFQQVGAAPLT